MYKVLFKSIQKLNDRIPTRFDDITKEILMDKAGVKAYKKITEQMGDVVYYKLGDRLGEVLNRII